MRDTTPKITLKWFLIVLSGAFAMSAVLNTGWLFSSYYQACADSFHLDTAQMGVLLSVIDAAGVFGYMLGGYLCDVLRPKACIIIGNLGMILMSLWCLSFPTSYAAVFIINAGLCLFGICFFWTAIVRYTTSFGPKELSGKASGFLFALSGGIMLIWGTVLSAVIAKSDAVNGLRFLLISSVVVLAATAIGQLIYDKEPWFGRGADKKAGGGFSFKMVGVLLRNPRMWVVLIIAMLTSTTFVALTYVQPLLAEYYDVSTAAITLIRTWTNNGTLLVMSVLTGILVDKLGSAAKCIAVSFICLIAGVVLMLVFPWQPSLLFIIIIAMVLIRCVNSIGKPGRVMLVSEVNIPPEAMGTATGLMFASTSIPGMFLNTIAGNMIANNAGNTVVAYHTIYIMFIFFGVAGILAVMLFQRLGKKQAAAEAK